MTRDARLAAAAQNLAAGGREKRPGVTSTGWWPIAEAFALAAEVLGHRTGLSPTALAAWRARDGHEPVAVDDARECVERLAVNEAHERSRDERRHLRFAAALILDAIDYRSAEWRKIGCELRASVDAADQHAVAEWCRYVSVRALRAALPERWLIAWGNGVNVISRGTELLIFDEYDNWLTARDQLAEAMSRLSSAGLSSWLEAIEPLDSKFERCTRFVEAPVTSHGNADAPAVGWWRYRAPLHLSDTLREGLAQRCPAVLG